MRFPYGIATAGVLHRIYAFEEFPKHVKPVHYDYGALCC